jgi:hypothetical protein
MEKHRLFEMDGEIVTPINTETVRAKKLADRGGSLLFCGIVMVVIGLIMLIF